MIGGKTPFPARSVSVNLAQAPRRLGRRFWLINLLLVLLYLWTFTEQSSVSVRVDDGVCTALTAGATSSVPCPGLLGGFVGLYMDQGPARPPLSYTPLDLLARDSAWRRVILSEAVTGEQPLYITFPDDLPGWTRVLGEWRPLVDDAVLRWRAPADGDYALQATLRRPGDPAGILMLDSGGEDGWAFIITPASRDGIWWRWRDGAPDEALVGIMYQKPLLAQAQSLLRFVLRGHQGALVLLLAAWLLNYLLAPILRRLPPLPRLSRRLTVLLIAFFIFATALVVAVHILERVPHVQDSITYLFQAQLLARGRLSAPAPALPAFFEHEFLSVRAGRWFGQYAPGYPLLLALGVWLGQPWLVNPLLAMLTIPLLYQLGRALYHTTTGTLAVLLAAVSPFLLFMSGSMMSHPAMLFWTTLFMLSWLQLLRRPRPLAWAIAAGIAAGMAFLTRQATALAIIAPYVTLSTMALWWQTPRRERRPLLAKRIPSAAVVVLGALPFVFLLFYNQAVLTGDPFTDPRWLSRPWDRLGFGLDVGEQQNSFLLSATDNGPLVTWFYDPALPPRGHSLARGLYNTEQNWRALDLHLFGWPPLFTLSFIWLFLLLARPGWPDWTLLAVLCGVVAVYVAFWASGIMYGPRYYYAALPALLLLTARGAQATAVWLGSRRGRWSVAVLLIFLVLYNVTAVLPRFVATYHGYNFVSGIDQEMVAATVDGEALVFIAADTGDWWEYGRFFSANTPWLDSRIIYARDRGWEANRRLQRMFPDRPAYMWEEGRLIPLPPT